MNWLDYNSLQPQKLNQLIVYTCYRSADFTISSLRSLETQINDVPNTKVAICENGTGEDSVRRLVETIERMVSSSAHA